MKPNNLNDSNSKPLTDEKHLSLEQIPPENFPLLLDAQKTKSDKLAEIAIFKGACQKLSELSQLVEFLKAYRLQVVVEIGTLRGGTFWLLCQLAEPDGTIISIDLPGGDFGGGYSSEELTAFKNYGSREQSLHFLRTDSHDELTVRELDQILGSCQIDLLMIDGDHRFEGVLKDFKMYSPLVQEVGLIAFHDILPHPQVSICQVDKLWQSLRKSYQNWEFTEPDDDRGWGQWGGIGVLKYDSSVNALI